MRERLRQDRKFGILRHADNFPYTSSEEPGKLKGARLAILGIHRSEEEAKAYTDRLANEGNLPWSVILMEEVIEAFSTDNEQDLLTEIVQVAGVAQAWAEDIAFRGTIPDPKI